MAVRSPRTSLRTAGAPHAIRLTPDRTSLAADGRSLLFVTAEVVDARGVVVPDAEHLIAFDIDGGSLAGLDNGREESAKRHQASTRTAFHSARHWRSYDPARGLGSLKVTARSEGAAGCHPHRRTTSARAKATTPPAVFRPDPGPGAPNDPLAEASYSGRPDTPPAAMLDGDAATGWSSAFYKSATALLPAFSGARPEDWVSVTWARPRAVDRVEVSFTVDATHTLPASVEVAVWDGKRYVPVKGTAVDWATASDTPTVITFDGVRGSRLRLLMASGHPGAVEGGLRISRWRSRRSTGPGARARSACGVRPGAAGGAPRRTRCAAGV